MDSTSAFAGLAKTGEQVLDEAYANRDSWNGFKAIYDGDDKETWSVVGERYVDLDRAGGYDATITLFEGLTQNLAHDAVMYLEALREATRAYYS
jgi:hypothetical protein